MLTFTNVSLAMAGAAAVVVPIAIHLLTLWRRQPQAWGAMRFVLEAYRRHRSRLRLERWLLLATRCLMLLLLGLSLAGPMIAGGGWLAGLPDGQRYVYLVIDDSLSTQARDWGDQTRLDSLKDQALAIVDQLGAADRVAVWRSGRPGSEVLAATNEVQRVRDVIGSLRPGASRSDLLDTLTQVYERVRGQAWPADQVFVVLLSDFSASTLSVDRAVPKEVTQLGQRCRFVVLRPKPAVANTQIQGLAVVRKTILAEQTPGHRPTASLDLTLRRFVDLESTLPTQVELTAVRGATLDVIATLRREVSWSRGQAVSKMQVELPLILHNPAEGEAGPLRRPVDPGPVDPGPVDPGPVDPGLVVVRAAIVEADQDLSDAISVDDARGAVIRLKDRLTVGLIDSYVTGGVDANAAIPARRWLELAITPWAVKTNLRGPAQGRPRAIGVEEIEASSFTDQELEGLDAVWVIRPDLVSGRGWETLRQFVDRGATAWVTPPGPGHPASMGQGFDGGFWGRLAVGAGAARTRR